MSVGLLGAFDRPGGPLGGVGASYGKDFRGQEHWSGGATDEGQGGVRIRVGLRDGAIGQGRFRGNKGQNGGADLDRTRIFNVIPGDFDDHLIFGAYKSRRWNFKARPLALCWRNVRAFRPKRPSVSRFHPVRPLLRVALRANYAATQKKVWAEQKNAYLVLARESASQFTGIYVMANSTPITIKKYANRRLYNTASSAYVTLADLAKMVKAGEDFIVYDAKTNEDITRSVLTQIIFEQEGIEGQSLLPTTFLRQLIGFYGDSMQAILPSYLEFSIDRFSGEQQAMREAASRMFGPEAFSAGSFAALQELTKKNFTAFNQALAMFSPFAGATQATDLAPKKANSGDDIDEMRSQLSDMQKRLESLAKKTETP